MFPEPREQAKAIGVYGFVASAGGSVGLLAGGVLTQAINWHWIFFVNIPIGDRHRRPRDAAARRRTRASASARARTSRARVLITSSLMLGVYTIVKPAAEHGWGAGRTLGLGRRLARAAGGVHRARGDGSQPADPAADLPLAQRHRARTSIQALLGRRDVRDVLPRVRCTCERVLGYAALEIGLAFLPATIVMGDAVAPLRGAADHALRRADDAAPRPGADRRRAGPVRAGAGRRHLRASTSCRAMLAARRRRRLSLPGADDARDVGRHAARTRAWPPVSSTRRRRSAARSGLAVLATLSASRSDSLLAGGDSTAPR